MSDRVHRVLYTVPGKPRDLVAERAAAPPVIPSRGQKRARREQYTSDDWAANGKMYELVCAFLKATSYGTPPKMFSGPAGDPDQQTLLPVPRREADVANWLDGLLRCPRQKKEEKFTPMAVQFTELYRTSIEYGHRVDFVSAVTMRLTKQYLDSLE